ncbi:hypothetical protein BJF85_19035 [Saccharomonospora sp. CUA-673]|nr:hypothetical protein BJF85_19035 [Saccharomonospora sp. CUA-673]
MTFEKLLLNLDISTRLHETKSCFLEVPVHWFGTDAVVMMVFNVLNNIAPGDTRIGSAISKDRIYNRM